MYVVNKILISRTENFFQLFISDEIKKLIFFLNFMSEFFQKFIVYKKVIEQLNYQRLFTIQYLFYF